MKQEMQGRLPGRTRIVSFMIALAALLALGSCKPRVKSAGCDIISFAVDSVEWIIDGDNITRVYPEGTAPLTPSITLSPGATITPAPDAPRDFFTGVSYTVTAENDTTTRTYAAKAATSMTGVTGECTWTLAGKPGDYTLVIGGRGAMEDYEFDDDYGHGLIPWIRYGREIKTLVIEDGVTVIGDRAFVDCALTGALNIPNSVTDIGSFAFCECSGLTSASIPNSVTDIGSCAFYECSGLTSASIPNSVTTIGDRAFFDCDGLTGALTIPNSITAISDYAFYGCSGLTSVIIPGSVTSIGDGAFYDCSGLTSATIPGSVRYIGSSAFVDCSGLAGALTIPDSVRYIGSSAFWGCSGLAGALTIPTSVTEIGDDAFYGCSGLTSVIIPGSVTSIGDGAFYGCSGLTSATIPASATKIDERAFWGCSGLTSVTNHSATPQDISERTFGDMSSATLRVPSSAVEAYKNAGGWKDFGTIIGM